MHAAARAEAQVVDLFRRCFERDDIGPDDDFFGLGGDSLLASRLLARLYELWGAELPPDALFRCPTPRSLARAFGAAGGAPEAERSPSLVPLQPGRGAPVFLAHPTSGNPWVFRPLVRAARLTRPVFGLRAPDLDWDLDVLGLEEMALHYALEIRRVQRRGPYALAGYSFGGNLAFEIARRLCADGHEVRHLVMLDTDGPHTPWSRVTAREQVLNGLRRLLCHAGRPGVAVLDRLGFTSPIRRAFLCFGPGPLSRRELRRVLDVAFPGGGAERAELMRAEVAELCQRIVAHFKPVLTAAAWEYLLRRAPEEDAQVLVKAHKVWAKNEWLARRHRPSWVFPGTITIFACAGNRAVLRWQRHASRPLDVRSTPIASDDHTSFLDEGCVEHFAPALRALLESERG